MSTYTVRRGDTLSGIAAEHGLSLQSLERANRGIRNPNEIHVGERLDLPGRSDSFESHGKGGTSSSSSSPVRGGNAALAWEHQFLGSHDYSDLCLGFVNQAFKHAGRHIPELNAYDAADALARVRSEGKLHPYVAGRNPPRGAILFYGPDRWNGRYGHVCISNGDGTVTSSGWPGQPVAVWSIAKLSQHAEGEAPAGYFLP